MVLSDVDIRRYMELGKIRISPELPDKQFGSCSVDFRLGSEFSVFDHSRYPYIDLRETGAIQDIMRTVHVKPGEPFILQPREFALAITEESLELDDDVLGRLGRTLQSGTHRHHRSRNSGTFRPGLARKGDARTQQSWTHARCALPRACASVHLPLSNSRRPCRFPTTKKPGTNTPANLAAGKQTDG